MAVFGGLVALGAHSQWARVAFHHMAIAQDARRHTCRDGYATRRDGPGRCNGHGGMLHRD
jgi:hypothetical protein